MNIEWLLEFITKIFSFLLLLNVLLLEQEDLSLEVWNTWSFVLRNIKLSLQIRNMLSDILDIIKSLLIVDLSLLKSTLLNLNLLIKKCKLFVSLNKLGTKNISFVDNHLIIFSLLLLFRFCFTDNILQSGDVTFLGFDHFLWGFDVSSDFSDVHI